MLGFNVFSGSFDDALSVALGAFSTLWSAVSYGFFNASATAVGVARSGFELAVSFKMVTLGASRSSPVLDNVFRAYLQCPRQRCGRRVRFLFLEFLPNVNALSRSFIVFGPGCNSDLCEVVCVPSRTFGTSVQ